MARKTDPKLRHATARTTKQRAEQLPQVKVDTKQLTDVLVGLAPRADGLKAVPAADVALAAARLDALAQAHAARGLAELVNVATTLRDMAGLTERRGTDPLDNPALDRPGKRTSPFQDAFDGARERDGQRERAEDPLGGPGKGIPRNTHAEGAPGVTSRPAPGGSLRGRAGGIAGQDSVSVEVTETGTYIVTYRDELTGVLTQTSEHADGSATERTVTERVDGVVMIDIYHYDSGGVFSDRQIIKIPPPQTGGGTAGSQDPNSDAAGGDSWLIQAMMEIAARIRPPKGDFRIPTHVNPGPEGGTPQPEGARIRPGDELVVNPSPDHIQGKDRELDPDTAERLRGGLKSPDRVNPPGPRGK